MAEAEPEPRGLFVSPDIYSHKKPKKGIMLFIACGPHMLRTVTWQVRMIEGASARKFTQSVTLLSTK